MAKISLNPLTDTPEKLTDLTKKFMLDYVKAKGTDKDKKWFQDLYKKHRIEKPDRLKPERTVVGIDNIGEFRKAFAMRFFPQLIKIKQSYDDEISQLI